MLRAGHRRGDVIVMGPSRGDTICGNVAIEALGPMHFGALALGPIHLARNPTEPRMWLATVERTLLPRSVDVSRFMAGIGELAARTIPGAVPLVLVDREADFCVVGYRAIEGARTLASIAEEGVDDAAAVTLAGQLATTLADFHQHGAIHGLLTPTTIIHDGARWWTWEYGIAGFCSPERLAARLRPLGGDAVAPELRAGGEMSPASDVYGWGATVACLLTGTSGSDAIAMLQDSDADDALRELVRAALDPIPELRPRDGAALCTRLRDVAPAAFATGPADAAAPAAASESSEFSFAELNDPVEPAPPPRPAEGNEIVELLVLGPDDEEGPPVVEANGAAPGPDTSERWRELAEQYLSEHADATEPEPTPIPEPDPEPAPTAADRRSVEALGRVALVRTRVRTGPHKPSPLDHVAVSGEFEMSQDPEPEPATPPREAEGARDLPLGTPDEEEWDDPDAAVFDLSAPGAPQVNGEDVDVDPDPDEVLPPAPPAIAEPALPWSEPTPVDGLGTRRLPPPIATTDELAQDAADAEPEPSPRLSGRADDVPRVDRRPQTPPPSDAPVLPRVPLAEAPPVAPGRALRSTDEPSIAVDRTPSRPSPVVVDRTPSRPQTTVDRASRSTPVVAELSGGALPRERGGAAVAWTVALLAAGIAIGATLAAARERGGLSRLMSGAPLAASTDPPAAADEGAEGGTKERPPVVPGGCPATMRPVEGTRACIDEAEAPGLREIPQTKVTLAEARAWCAEHGARLCSAAQWRAACRGPRNWRHPYGARGEADRCNGASSSGAPQNLSRTGARDRCVTPSGVYDLEGNVGEWVEDGAVLGGDSTTRSPSCDSRIQPASGWSSPSTGFRCCVDLADASE